MFDADRRVREDDKGQVQTTFEDGIERSASSILNVQTNQTEHVCFLIITGQPWGFHKRLETAKLTIGIKAGCIITRD